MSKHTEGPWYVGDDGHICATWGDGQAIDLVEFGGFLNPADGALAVAAPEMLALLRELEWYLEGHVCPRCGGTRPNHLDLCRLAALLERLK